MKLQPNERIEVENAISTLNRIEKRLLQAGEWTYRASKKVGNARNVLSKILDPEGL